MTSRRAQAAPPPPRRRRAGRLALIAALAVVALAGPARADRVDDLARVLDGARGEKDRIAAAVQLGRLREPRALRPLIGALSDRSNVVRAVAAGALGFLGDPLALPALRRATEDPDRTVRRRAGEAIALLRDPHGPARQQLGLANYKVDGREAPRLAGAPPSLFVVMKSTADRSVGRADATTRRQRAGQIKALLLGELGKHREVTLERTTAEKLGIEPYAIDVSITRLARGDAGPYVEIDCQLRVAVSNRRGKLISLLTGGAKVQVPKRGWNGRYEGQLRLEAMQNAVKSVHQDLITYLTKRPT